MKQNIFHKTMIGCTLMLLVISFAQPLGAVTVREHLAKNNLTVIIDGIVLQEKDSRQLNDLNRIFEKYEDNDNVEAVNISGGMLSMFAKGDDIDNETRDLFNKILGIRILNVPKSENTIYLNLEADITNHIDSYEYDRIMNIKSDGERVQMFVSHSTPVILMIVSDDDEEFSVISMPGNIDSKVIESALNGKITIIK